MKRILIGLSVMAACGGGGEDAPECGLGQVIANGDPDGGAYAIQFAADQYAFINALGGNPGTLDVTMGGTPGATLHLEWDDLVANGDSVDARGHIVTGAGYGNCATGPLDSTLTMADEGSGGTFVLRHLRMGPPFCGEEVPGEIVGCFRSPN